MLIIIQEQHLYLSWLCILGKQLRFWTWYSMIPLTRLYYTLSWSRQQNVITLVQLGCKGNAWYSFFLHVNCYDIMFLQEYHA